MKSKRLPHSLAVLHDLAHVCFKRWVKEESLAFGSSFYAMESICVPPTSPTLQLLPFASTSVRAVIILLLGCGFFASTWTAEVLFTISSFALLASHMFYSALTKSVSVELS